MPVPQLDFTKVGRCNIDARSTRVLDRADIVRLDQGELMRREIVNLLPLSIGPLWLKQRYSLGGFLSLILDHDRV